MKYIKENKNLLINYLIIIISNIIIYILSKFYIKDFLNKIYIFFIILSIFDYILYYLTKTKFKAYLDIIASIITSLILIPITNNIELYTTTVVSIVIANNVAYIESKKDKKLIKNILVYLIATFHTILIAILSYLLYGIIK